MRLYMVGLDHSAVPVEVRNACHLSRQKIRNCLTSLFAIDGLSKDSPRSHAVMDREMIILSTRSRLEVYVATEAAVADAIPTPWLREIQCQAHVDIMHPITQRQDREAVEHLLRIASGMELPLLGETYILEQMAAALVVAQACGAAGPVLAHVFQHAIRIGRLAFAESDTRNCAIFLGRAVRHVLDQRHPEIANGNLLIVGASKMAHLAPQIVRHRNLQPTAFIDRTVTPGKAAQKQMLGQIFPWHQMRIALVWADVVVAADLALHPILDADDIAFALGQRRGRPLLLIDLGLSHNVHPAAAVVENIVYYDLDDLRVALADLVSPGVMGAESLGPWTASFPGLEQMIHEEVSTLCTWIEHAKPSNATSRSTH